MQYSEIVANLVIFVQFSNLFGVQDDPATASDYDHDEDPFGDLTKHMVIVTILYWSTPEN